MKKFILVVAALALSACSFDHYRLVSSEMLFEEAVVVDLPYVPAGHGSSSGVGMSLSGDLHFSSGSVNIPERKAIVFECQHGRFVVQNHPQLWGKLKVGQRVRVSYKEITEQYVSGKTEEVLSSRFVSLDFVDANPI